MNNYGPNYPKIVALSYLVFALFIFFSGKKCTTDDICMLLCINMGVTYLFKKG